MTGSPRAPRVLLVCTRDVPAHAESGRERTMAFILRSLRAGGEVQTVRLYSLLERRSAGRFVGALGAALRGIVTLRPQPLQALLFHDAQAMERVLEIVDRWQPQAVVFDGVRSGSLALPLRAARPGLRLVCDFDDLMSRRMELLARSRQPISMGYLKKLVPTWVQRHVLDGIVGRGVQAYEARALRGAEDRIGRACDDNVLVSAVDAGHLRSQSPAVRVTVIPPYMGGERPIQPLQPVERFAFIGADSLLQNRQAIEFLVGLWARVRPATPLHVFGRQSGSYPDAPNVVFRGFVADLADAYAPGTVLLAPSFLSGGVKTKVLEAMSFGIVPLGTKITFEGIEADCRALTATADELADWVRDPASHCATWAALGAEVIAEAAARHGEGRLAALWRDLVWPPA